VAARLVGADEEFRVGLMAKILGTDGELGMLLARAGAESGSLEAAMVLLSKSDVRPIEVILKRLIGAVVEAKGATDGGGY
jgi:hypothetical protein